MMHVRFHYIGMLGTICNFVQDYRFRLWGKFSILAYNIGARTGQLPGALYAEEIK